MRIRLPGLTGPGFAETGVKTGGQALPSRAPLTAVAPIPCADSLRSRRKPTTPDRQPPTPNPPAPAPPTKPPMLPIPHPPIILFARCIILLHSRSSLASSVSSPGCCGSSPPARERTSATPSSASHRPALLCNQGCCLLFSVTAFMLCDCVESYHTASTAVNACRRDAAQDVGFEC